MSNIPNPTRGEVWTVDLNPTRGREQAGHRPALIISADELNASPRGLVVIVPIGGTARRLPTHVALMPPEGGVDKPSYAMVEQVRSISKDRLDRRFGAIKRATMDEVVVRLRWLLELGSN